MKIANCLIIREENKYLREFIEYYKSIGYDNILLYDNNNTDGEFPEEVVKDYIDSGFVVYHNVRGKNRVQKSVYNDCLRSHGNTYDWISFFDTDEFISIKNMKGYLSLPIFDNFNEILINWKMIDDGDVVSSSLPLLKRKCNKLETKCYKNGVPLNWTVKTIVRPSKDIYFKRSVHHVSGLAKSCNYHGKPVFSCLYVPCENPNISLYHFKTKTISEYVKRVSVGDVNLVHGIKLMYSKLKSFFTYNKITKEKLDIIKEVFPDFKLLKLQSKNIDVVIPSECYSEELESNIKQYMPFIKTVWKFDDFQNIIQSDCAERLLYINAPVKFNYKCIESDFFVGHQTSKCLDNVIVPLYKALCKNTLEESIELHDNFGYRDTLTFKIGINDKSTKITI